MRGIVAHHFDLLILVQAPAQSIEGLDIGRVGAHEATVDATRAGEVSLRQCTEADDQRAFAEGESGGHACGRRGMQEPRRIVNHPGQVDRVGRQVRGHHLLHRRRVRNTGQRDARGRIHLIVGTGHGQLVMCQREARIELQRALQVTSGQGHLEPVQRLHTGEILLEGVHTRGADGAQRRSRRWCDSEDTSRQPTEHGN